MPRKAFNAAAPHRLFSQGLTAYIELAGHPATPAFVLQALKRQHPRLRVSLPTVRNWLTGRTFPTWPNLEALADWLKLHPSVLLYGEAFRPAQTDPSGGMTLDRQTQSLVENFLQLNKDQRQITLLVVQALLVKQHIEFTSLAGGTAQLSLT